MNKFVIRIATSDEAEPYVYWNNETGYGCQAAATKYLESEMETVMPTLEVMDGSAEWVKVNES